MRIALLSNGIPPFVMGGMQTHSLNMARHLAGLGVSIDLYHVVQEGVSAKEVREKFTEEQNEHIRTFEFQWPRRLRFPGHYVAECCELSRLYLERYLESEPTDVVYAKGLMGSAFIEAARDRKNGIPSIVTNAHGYEMFQKPATMIERLRQCLLRPAFRNVIQRSDFVGSYGGRITKLLTERLNVSPEAILEIPGAISDGSPAFESTGDRRGRRRICFVGRYERRKGLEELVKAIQTVDRSRYELDVVGPIPKNLFANLGENVKMHGSITDREELYRILENMDVLVCPSWSEGMPNVILEAMACGCAIIATDVGAVAVLVDQANGWLLAEPKPTLIRNAILQAIGLDDKSLQKMQSTSIRRVEEKFTWDVVAKQMLEKFGVLVTTNPKVKIC